MFGLIVVLTAMYGLQGCIVGISEFTIPQLLSGQGGDLNAAKILSIVKLPAALKIFVSPLFDSCITRMPGGLKGIVISLQVVICAGLVSLSPLLQLEGEPTAAALALRWPLFAIAMLNAMADLGMDSFALIALPAHLRQLPAFCQVFGIFIGKLCARSGLRLMMSSGVMSPPGFILAMAVALAMCTMYMMIVPAQTNQAEESKEPVSGVIARTWEFCTVRPNMIHWLLYQLIMPAMYFHTVALLPIRYEQLGLRADEYATVDIFFAVVVAVCMMYALKMASDTAQPLTFFLKAYILQAMLSAGQVLQYMMWPGTPTTAFSITYSFFGRMQELMFYIFEFGEFAFYGRVAMLEPTLVSTLVTLQTSVFNFSDFFHGWLAITLVEQFSLCPKSADNAEGVLVCQFDAYPFVACGISLTSLLYLLTQWKTMAAYQDLQDNGWTTQSSNLWRKLFLAILVAATIVPTVGAMSANVSCLESFEILREPLLEQRAREVFHVAMNYGGTSQERQLLDQYIKDVLDSTKVPQNIESSHMLHQYLQRLMLDEVQALRNYTPEMVRENAGTLEFQCERIRQNTPMNMVDGMWANTFVPDAVPDPWTLIVDRIRYEEQGEGNMSKNHPFMWQRTAASVGYNFPPINSLEFAYLKQFANKSFLNAALTASVGRVPGWVPEKLGMIAFLEMRSSAPCHKQIQHMKVHGLDFSYYQVHRSIDNPHDGHATQIMDAIDAFMLGSSNRQEEIGRIQGIIRGYHAFEFTIDAIDAAVDEMLEHGGCPTQSMNDANRLVQPPSRTESSMLHFLTKHSHAFHFHRGPEHEALKDPETMILHLKGRCELFQPGKVEHTRFLQLFRHGGPMYGVGDHADHAVLKEFAASVQQKCAR